jgi:hypothetical protein
LSFAVLFAGRASVPGRPLWLDQRRIDGDSKKRI